MAQNNCKFGCLGLLLLLLSSHSIFALRLEFDNKKEIADWELGPNATAKVANGKTGAKMRSWGREYRNLFW